MSNPTWEETEEVSTTPSQSSTVPTWDDTTGDDELLATPDVDAIEANRRAMLQGASLGLSDELTAGAKALGETVFGDKKFADLLDTYRSQVKQERDKLKEGKEQYPTSTTVAEIGGSILPSFATGGIGAVSSIGKVPAMTSAMKLGASGLVQGGATGFGESEADLTNPTAENLMEAGKDTGIGAGVGFGAGIALPMVAKGAGSAIKSTGNALLDLAPETTKLTKKAFDLAKKGTAVVGDEANEALIADAKKTAQTLKSEFSDMYKKGSNLVGESFDLDSKNVPKTKLEELMNLQNSYKGKIKPEDEAVISRVLANLEETVSKEKTVPGIYKAMDEMQGFINKAQAEGKALGQNIGFTNPKVDETSNLITTLRTSQNELGESIPKFKAIDIPEDEIITETQKSIKDLSFSDLNNKIKELENIYYKGNLENVSKIELKGIIDNAKNMLNSPQLRSQKSIDLMNEGNSILKNVRTKNEIIPTSKVDITGKMQTPTDDLDLAEMLLSRDTNTGIKNAKFKEAISDLSPQVKEMADDIDLRQQIAKKFKSEGALGGTPTSMLIGSQTLPIRAGAALGNITNKAEKITKPVADFTKNMIRMEDTAITGLANKLRTSGNPNASDFADKLDKIVQSPKRDRLLWSLSQQPAFRELVNKDDEQN